MATRSCLHRMSPSELLAHPVGQSSATSRHSDKNAKPFFSVLRTDVTQWWWTNGLALGPARGAYASLLHEKKIVLHRSCADPVNNYLFVGVTELGDSFIIRARRCRVADRPPFEMPSEYASTCSLPYLVKFPGRVLSKEDIIKFRSFACLQT
ncbi:hypothetical protein PoB_007512800 [Plakobranchus ocellatus]|uniref:Uncharacterized protein n=1 Tax=Plakobranchus ocellatus TaxID=259542 RepID=A0AAV4DWZ2_9GAST|nr:hypothetical protein PoB_007512800 [Plakobranchus ocellatus]